jgi:hypothetical protein
MLLAKFHTHTQQRVILQLRFVSTVMTFMSVGQHIVTIHCVITFKFRGQHITTIHCIITFLDRYDAERVAPF